MKPTLAFPALVATGVLLLISGCGNNIQRVHAQGQTFVVPHPETSCPTGCIAMQSNPNFLELRLGPTTNTQQDGFSTTLPFPMTVKLLDVWIGTQSGAAFESDSRLQIVLPDGTFYEYKAQYDKHQDVVGSIQRAIPVNLTLPAGTVFYVYHAEFGIVSCPQGCGYDTTWSLSAF